MTDTNEPKAEIIKKTRVREGFLKIESCEVKVTKRDGSTQILTREVMERGHAVGILGYDPVRDEVLMTNEMRIGPLMNGENPFYDSLPAGMIDKHKGENAVQAAKREMLEETGEVLRDPVVIHSGAYVSAGGTSETMALVFGIIDTTNAGGIHGEADEGEYIKSVAVKSDDFINRASTGGLHDLKSLAAAFWFAHNRERIRREYKRELKQNKRAPKV